MYNQSSVTLNSTYKYWLIYSPFTLWYDVLVFIWTDSCYMPVTCSSRHTSCKVSCHFCYLSGDDWKQTCLCDVFFFFLSFLFFLFCFHGPKWHKTGRKKEISLLIFPSAHFGLLLYWSSATKPTTCWTRAIMQSYVIRRTSSVSENRFFCKSYLFRALTINVAWSVFITVVLNKSMFVNTFPSRITSVCELYVLS